MPKQSGIGALLLVNGYDISGDVGVINGLRASQNLQDVTGLDKSAVERLPLLADGAIDFTGFFNDAAGQEHAALRNFGTGDKYVTLSLGSTLGATMWSLTGKQVDYGATRGNDGSLGINAQIQSSDGEGLLAGKMLTAGKRTDTGATTGSSVDGAAATTAGAVLRLHVFSFTGTDATVKVQDSANNSAWLDLSGAAFTAVTSAPTSQRIALSTSATVRRYLRVVTTTSGGFTSMVFAVSVARR